MRSFFAVLALAVPVATASAAPAPNLFHHSNVAATASTQPVKAQRIRVTFHSARTTDCELVIGDQAFRLRAFATRPIFIDAGSPVRIFSEQDSHLHGQTLVTVGPEHADQVVTVE